MKHGCRRGFGRGVWVWAIALAVLAASAAAWHWRAKEGRAEPRAWPLPDPPSLQSKAAVLFDFDAGEPLFTKSAHERLAPGELAKVFAARLIALDHSLDEPVRVSREAIDAPGPNLTLHEGESVPLERLLLSMLFRPGAGSSVALAEHADGSVAAFANRMSLEALRLGAERTRFTNPHGLDDPDQRSSAHDLALLARAALAEPLLQRVLGMERGAVSRRDGVQATLHVNSFLRRYPGVVSAKTSYTPDSGHSLAALAQRDGARLLAIILGAPSAEDRYHDAALLLDYGFRHREALLETPAIERTEYEVRPGDTLSGLARQFDVPIGAIRSMNDLGNPDQLTTGEKLWIPK